MANQLRDSQVETLQAVMDITARPRIYSVSAHLIAQRLGISEQAARRRLGALEDRRCLAKAEGFGRYPDAFYPTQLGREALEEGDA